MFWPWLVQRRRQPELMDQPGLDPLAHHEALRSLKRINCLSDSAGIFWRPILELSRKRAGTLTLLDVATGGGDVLAGLARRAKRAGISLRLEGCDISSVALEHAAKQTSARLFAWDALRDPLPGQYDVVTTSLFLHHLDEPEAVLLLRRMKQMARHLLLINDLERGPLGWVLAWLGARVLSRSPIVHFDAPVSVEGAFTSAEARQLARRAGLEGVRVNRRYPCRYLLSWERPR